MFWCLTNGQVFSQQSNIADEASYLGDEGTHAKMAEVATRPLGLTIADIDPPGRPKRLVEIDSVPDIHRG